MLIVLEGIDGSGKDTQARYLSKSINAIIKSYPDRNGLFGDLFNRVLGGKVHISGDFLFPMFLMDMYKDRQLLREYKSSPSKHLILVRYFYSTLAYQGAQGFDYDEGKRVIDAFDLVDPDYVFILDVLPKIALERSHRSTREIFEKVEFLEKVRSNYRRIYEDKFRSSKFYWIDTTYPKQEIANHILSLLDF